MDKLEVQALSGRELLRNLDALADLRICVFREFPYLYEGNTDYEARYLQKYAETADSVVVVVREGERIVGASSALPLAAEDSEVRRPFEERGYAVDRVFYYGESVLLPEYRGHGLGVRFFQERERHARSLDRFDLLTFCAVQRPYDHPRRPADYQPLDEFWQRRGFSRHPELRAAFKWQDLDEAAESPKPMVFWLKPL